MFLKGTSKSSGAPALLFLCRTESLTTEFPWQTDQRSDFKVYPGVKTVFWSTLFLIIKNCEVKVSSLKVVSLIARDTRKQFHSIVTLTPVFICWMLGLGPRSL